MNLNRRRLLNLALALAVSGVCLAFFVAGADWPAVGRAITAADHRWLAPAGLCIWASMVARAFRWRILLLEQKRIGLVRLYNLQMVGVLATGLLPGRIGEIVKPVLLARRERMSFFGVMGTVVMERILDLALVVIATVGMLLVFPFPAGSMITLPGAGQPTPVRDVLQGLGFTAAALCAGMLAFTVFLVHAPRLALGLVDRVLGWISRGLAERVRGLVERFQTGLAVFRQPRRALRSAAWTLPIWAGILLSEYLLFLSFGVEAGLLGACLLMASIALAVAVPQAPGFVGVFQLAARWVLVACFGVDEPVADAYAIVLWCVQMAFLIGVGFLSLAHEGLTLAEVRRAESEPAGAGGSLENRRRDHGPEA